MHQELAGLDGARLDALIVGAGSVGVGTTLAFASSGLSVALIDNNDFASGTSSRSSRVMNCGLMYLAPNNGTVWQSLRQPAQFALGIKEARLMMKGRSRFARYFPHLARIATTCYPIYSDGNYRGWQVDFAFKLLRALDPGGLALNYRRIPRKEALELPLLRWLRDPDKLQSVAMYDEVLCDWPERMLYEVILTAREHGAKACNYTRIETVERATDGLWHVTLRSTDGQCSATVQAKGIVNASGVWIDQVNQLFPAKAERTVISTKGTHITAELPPECRDYGVITTDRNGKPFMILPCREFHLLGPTWDPFTGDPASVGPTGGEVDYVLAETNAFIPGARLTRANIRFGWAGLRSLAYDSAHPQGRRGMVMRDLAPMGMQDVLAITGSPMTVFVSTGERVRDVLTGDRSSAAPATTSHPPSADKRWAHAARHEDVRTLVDLLFRRTGEGWDADLGLDRVEAASEVVSEALGWDDSRRRAEVERYREYVERNHVIPGD